jgi:hypothetical protein
MKTAGANAAPHKVFGSQLCRAMTLMSKDSAEEFKKQVRIAPRFFDSILIACATPSLSLSATFGMFSP